MDTTLLGGLSPAQFLEEYWQKKPLLVRGAVPGFSGFVTPDAMMDLASRDDGEARLVEFKDGVWHARHGPFKPKELAKKRKHPWAVLVQGLDMYVPEAEAFMRRFNFIPWARLDDLMVSYAVDQGGVGPHFDDYDVFIVQGLGRRLWQIGPQEDKTLVEGAPLKILKNFKPAEEWIVEPGDMLYLPPHWAHNGIALGECMNYSVGFRSPNAQELADEFLSYLQERIEIPGLYADPDLKLQAHPGEIGDAMVAQVADMLSKIRWDQDDVRNFLGCYLSEPKPRIYFSPPEEPLSRKRFLSAWKKGGLALDPRTQMLFSRERFFLNGDSLEELSGEDEETLRRLTDERRLASAEGLGEDTLDLIYEWYLDGFLHVGRG
ncbi:MAG: cupin domain-containing protein [Rhodocyclaceae bacterium]|nr:cupin domain-containing protein [Rhodocyclaceae bacterium]